MAKTKLKIGDIILYRCDSCPNIHKGRIEERDEESMHINTVGYNKKRTWWQELNGLEDDHWIHLEQVWKKIGHQKNSFDEMKYEKQLKKVRSLSKYI